MKTYLALVNQVLVEMREEEVSTVTQDEYSALIGSFVNKAKAQVEDTYAWSALMTDFSVPTVVGQEKYVLTNTDNRAIIDVIVNETGQSVLSEYSRRWIDTEYKKGNVISARPTRWANDGVDSNGDTRIVLYPKPVAVETLNISAWVRAAELTTELDELTIPFRPVVDLALAFAVRERGEVAGQTSLEYFEVAKRSLSDEIAYDAARNEDQSEWYAV